MNTYEIVKNEFGEMLKQTDETGFVSWVPMVAGNADYEAYLNPVEHLTEIPTSNEA